ncbi:MAG: carbohydrate kinase family protein [Eubacteriales bacterium]|nr:carbohydrate kinase family protein [Eubacteriales bacterium]
MARSGICVAGNLIVDISYPVSAYPSPGQLVTVLDNKTMTVGGLACSVGIDLARLDSKLPVRILGCLGDDPEGRFILEQFGKYDNIHSEDIRVTGQTSYTLVMNDASTRERTFFQFRGANSAFDGLDVKWDAIDAKILHAGYILLMDGLDAQDLEYGTRMARMLARAKKEGMLTSIDVVSEASERFKDIVPPALKYTDYCVINEYEAGKTTGIPLRDESGKLIAGKVPKALEALKALGVARWAVIHAPEGSFGLDGKGEYITLPCLKLPQNFVKGTTGAGDAFCSGTLYGAHEGMGLLDALRLGTATAAASLGEPDANSGVKPFGVAMDFYREMGGK